MGVMASRCRLTALHLLAACQLMALSSGCSSSTVPLGSAFAQALTARALQTQHDVVLLQMPLLLAPPPCVALEPEHGSDVLCTVPAGTRLTVTKIEKNWDFENGERWQFFGHIELDPWTDRVVKLDPRLFRMRLSSDGTTFLMPDERHVQPVGPD
jgi:hypothetical protein